MGNLFSEEHFREIDQQRYNEFLDGLSDGPDISVNQTIVKFCGLDSSAILRRHYETRRMGAGDRAPDWFKSLAEKLGAFTSAPELAGLGALAIAIFIDIESFSPPEESTEDALRCVFAEEKASEIWDQIDECLKRYMVNIANKDDLRSDLKRIEGQLSIALTKLKNSMLRDGHMTFEALKSWVNGAAFHIQMLIQLVRLGGIDTCDPVIGLLSTYQNDLNQLFKEHKEMISKKCSVQIRPVPGVMNLTVPTYLVDEYSTLHLIASGGTFVKYFQTYYDRRYGQKQPEVRQYFSDVRKNLQSLVSQTGSFNYQ